jgi:hypothetical protein
MIRSFVVRFASMGLFLFAGASVARAQAPRGMATMPLPLASDLKKVPVGSWSEYTVNDGQNVVSARMALVARSARSVDVETQIKGGPVAALGHTTMRMSLPLGDATEIKPTEQVIQLGENPPMLLPLDATGGASQSFKRPDPKKRVGTEAVKVPGGAFAHADHYQDKGPSGETIDYWISKDVLPFGLVKVLSGGGNGPSVTMELVGHGKDAKPTVTGKPQPFDPAVIMKQAQPAMAGTKAPAASGGPPLRPVPSPHPGMPPTSPSNARPPSGAKAPAAKPASPSANPHP